MHFSDKITMDAVRRTADGYLATTARVARTGIQVYSGAEVGKPELKSVKVFRPEAEVFNKDAMGSFAHRPVTRDHPSVMITADNWATHAKGWTGDEVARDGEMIRVPMLLADASIIADVEAGTRELSMGYTCDLKWEEGTAPNGEKYDAVQTNIRANHLAVVAAARGGPALRIGDDNGDKRMTTKTIMVDGLPVEVSDKDAAIINRMIDGLNAKVTAAAAKATTDAAEIARLTALVSTRDGELAVAKQQVADTSLTPAKLDAAVAARATVIGDAKRIA
jgi:hypothetical protein